MNSSASGHQPWTDQALMGQMNVLNAILQHVHVDGKYLSSQCLLLSKILDSLVANNRKPLWRSELLPLVRKVCKHRDNPDARPALLLLLLSVKDAFRAEWFFPVHVTENDEIFTTLKSLFSSFTTSDDVLGKSPMQLFQRGGSASSDFQEARVYLDSISNRFYPRLQVISIFVAVHSKVGYEVLMCDFNVPHMHLQDRVCLYVGQKDNTESSTCIVTPLQANILVNGHQVEKRVTSGYFDAGPQMPSDVTSLVKVGSNVLQAIGEFSVSYVIAVASSRAIERSAKNAELQDYVSPIKSGSEVDGAEVDDEVVEGASRVSLRCPISHQRLSMPVKATTCRHLQSFDYDSFLEINEKRPAWRCPCCNVFISFSDLRRDRQMEKVLQDTDEKIHEVILNQDGSWVPVSTEDDETDRGPGVGEGGSIDLSDMDDEELNRKWQSSDVFQQHETKPDVETLIAMAENRTNASQTTNPVVWQQGTAENPVIVVPEFTAGASQSSPNFSGHAWVGGGNSEGVFVNVNGGGLYPTTSGTVDNQVQNQPATSVQYLSAVNHNFQVRFPWSRNASHVNSSAGPVNRMAPNSAHMTFTQLQPPPSDAPSNIGPVTANGWGRQRQVGQRSSGISLVNVQNIGEMRPQWRSTGVYSPQLGRNTVQHQNLHSSQQVHSSQSPVLRSPRQQFNPAAVPHPQHVSPGNPQQQRPSPGTNSHYHHVGPGTPSQSQRPSAGNSSYQHAASPGASYQQHSSPGASHQRPGVWVGANAGQWRSTTSSVHLSGGAAASEQSWRPAQRMRGSVANPSLVPVVPGPSPTAIPQQRATVLGPGSTVLGPIPASVPQQRAPAVTTIPSPRPFTTATNAGAIPSPRFRMQTQTQPVLAHNQQVASNVSLYNGTAWVNAPDFASAPLPAPQFTGLDMPECWINFDDLDSPH